MGKKGVPLSEAHKKALRVPRYGAGIYDRTDYHKRITKDGVNKAYASGIKMGFRLKKVVHFGSDNVNWKGGVTPLNEKIRKSVEYKIWQFSVFTRDNFTCVVCHKRGGDLHADHIKMFAFHPELRFAIDNGRTLCVSCHRKTSTYGRKKHLCCQY